MGNLAGKVVACVLLGEYNYAVDSKGRLNFPAKFREKMGQMFIVTKWLDNCLVAFPQEEWERMDALLEEKGMLKPRQVKRFLYAYACEVEPDKQGRILLSPSLRAHAGLTKDVTIIGVGRYAEIWDTAAWHKAEQELDSAHVEAAMEEMGF